MARLFERSRDSPETLEALQVRHGLLERLSRIQRSISHGAPLDDVLGSIAAGAAELLGDPVAGLRLVSEEDPTSMELVAATGLTTQQLAEVRIGTVGEGAGGRAIVEGDVVVVEDYPDTPDGIAAFGEFGVRSAMAAPIRVNARVVGSLTVASFSEGRRYGLVEQEILSALAEHAGLALLDASLIDRRERLVERQGEERFQALIRHSSDLIAIVDEEGAIAFATPSVGRVLRIAAERLPGSSLLAHVHPADRPHAAAHLRATAGRPGTMPPADWRLVPSGAQFQPRRWMHVEVLATNLLEHPSVGGIVLNARDVTERKRAEQARRDHDARYRQIVDTTHDGVWMTDPEDRTIFVNGALARMLGRPAEEIVGRRPADFMAPDQAKLVRAAMERRRRGVHDRYELTLERADGSPLHIVVSGTPMFSDGRFAGALALCSDITELLRAREENAQLEARLRQAQELETLGRLAGHVAHDFNQVLSVILGYASLLGPRLDDERARDDVARIVEAAEHGAGLARQLVMFSRSGEGAPEVVDLAEVVRTTARLVGATAPPGVSVEAQTDEAALPVVIDPTKVRQVIMNLIDNAFHALAGGGRLLLRTGEERLGAGPALGLAPGRYARLDVVDSGAGMPAEVLARALEPAFTTKPSGSGSGLGLAIVHGIVQQAGGHIDLDSQPGTGTTVGILLPLAGTTAGAERPHGPQAAPPASPQGATILLVEDDAAVLELTRRVLRERGYRVVATSTAEDALDVLRERGVDLLLADHTLPRMSGLELAGRVARVAPQTPTIVMSGYAAEVAGAHRADVAWLQKPFGASALLGAVRDALGRP